jgi:hypothetical protein
MKSSRCRRIREEEVLHGRTCRRVKEHWAILRLLIDMEVFRYVRTLMSTFITLSLSFYIFSITVLFISTTLLQYNNNNNCHYQHLFYGFLCVLFLLTVIFSYECVFFTLFIKFLVFVYMSESKKL